MTDQDHLIDLSKYPTADAHPGGHSGALQQANRQVFIDTEGRHPSLESLQQHQVRHAARGAGQDAG